METRAKQKSTVYGDCKATDEEEWLGKRLCLLLDGILGQD
jgi:hypothetical protein